jgi:hypothetical protein
MKTANVTIYHNPRCGKSRAALTLLLERGIDLTVVEYLCVQQELFSLPPRGVERSETNVRFETDFLHVKRQHVVHAGRVIGEPLRHSLGQYRAEARFARGCALAHFARYFQNAVVLPDVTFGRRKGHLLHPALLLREMRDRMRDELVEDRPGAIERG